MPTSARVSGCVRRLTILTTLIALSNVSASAQVVRIVKNLSGETVPFRPDAVAIDGAGASIYSVASSNQYGSNAEFHNQIFQWNAVTGAGIQLTRFPLDIATVSVSDDGQWIAFVSNGDLVGSNRDESYEVFVMHPDGTGLSQVTNDTSRVGEGVGTATMAGAGARIVYTADTDPLGTNPGRTPHYFAVDRGGTNLVQLAEASVVRDAATISDDGSRVVFYYNDPANNGWSGWIYSSPGDGSAPPVIIATIPLTTERVVLSGNGQVVVYDLNDGTLGKVNIDGTGPISPLATGDSPSITDDGLTVYYTANGVIKIGSDGTGGAIVAPGSPTLFYGIPAVSGDGTRLVASAWYGEIPGGSNPDQGLEVVAMDTSGGNLIQLSLMSVRPMGYTAPNNFQAPAAPRILTDGTRVYFVSDGDPIGRNTDHSYELFTALSGGTGLDQVTKLNNANVETLSVSDNGVVVFESYGSVIGPSNGDWQFYKINTNGTGLTKLTDFGTGPGAGRFPIVRFDGQWILYEGYNASGVFGLHTMSIDGGTVNTIAQVDSDPMFHYRLGTTPITYVAYDAPGNLDGQNPNHRFQVQRIGFTGAFYLRITSDPSYDSMAPDISGDGSKIVWYSQADFTGQNPDHNYEIFLYDVPTAVKRQLTNTTGGAGAVTPSITRDGSWVYYTAYATQGHGDVLRVSVATGEVQRVTGFTPYAARFCDVDGTGAKALFAGKDVIHQSPSWTSLFLSDQTAKPAFHVGKAAPTFLDWDPDPQSLNYDVIRGDLANLSTHVGTVNLGPVACLEDDSSDNQTLGNEDPAQPTAGQGFFYLYRGTLGDPAVTGSWGQGTGALERTPAGGACSP